MCTNVVSITPSIKLVKDGFKGSIDVPCGYCEECLAEKRTEYEIRFAYEFNALPSDGNAIMLLLTFNKEHDTFVTYEGKQYCTFNNDYLNHFKNAFGTAAIRKFGKGAYRYFFAPEKGENGDHKAHYHAIFFLQPNVNPDEFYDLVKEYWYNKSNYGYVFPQSFDNIGSDGSIHRSYAAFDRNIGKWVPKTILVKSRNGASKYCAKYVTKQAVLNGCSSFMDCYRSMPKNDKRIYSKYVPRYTFSKGFGFQMIERENLNNIDSLHTALLSGVRPPYFDFGNVSVPKYILRKLFYKYVKLGDVSPTNNKQLYTALPNDFFASYVRKYDLPAYERTLSRCYDFLASNTDILVDADTLCKSILMYRFCTSGSDVAERYEDYKALKVSPLSMADVSVDCTLRATLEGSKMFTSVEVYDDVIRDVYDALDEVILRYFAFCRSRIVKKIENKVKKAKLFYSHRTPLV